MRELLTVITSAVTALGIGGIAGALANLAVDRWKQSRTQLFEFKQRRYAAIVILMIARIGPKEDLPKLARVRPDLPSLDDVYRELDVELLNSFLYASDPVIANLAEFIQSPSRRGLLAVADVMRRDLYGNSTNLKSATIDQISVLTQHTV